MNKDSKLIPTGTILARGVDWHGEESISTAVIMRVATWEGIIGFHPFLHLPCMAGLRPSNPVDKRIAFLLAEEVGNCESIEEDSRDWLAENGYDVPSRDAPKP